MYQNSSSQSIDIESILYLAPGIMYWKDLNSVYLGCNHNFLDVAGLKNVKEIIGKTDQDMPWGSSTQRVGKYREDDEYVIETKNQLITEDQALITIESESKDIYLRTVKSPLFDKNGNVVGILGVSINITDIKEAEQLRLDATKAKSAMEQQAEFREFVKQIVHDIRSPIATLTMMSKHSTNLPDAVRFAFKNATVRLEDITNRLAQQYRPEDEDIDDSGEILVSTSLFDIISEKKYEYGDRDITITPHVVSKAFFAFIKGDHVDFKRMISNLINNAVAAFEDRKGGQIDIDLQVIDKTVELIIRDNGKGMPENVRQDILNNKAITYGKKDGNGLGLTHARDYIAKYNGKLNIESSEHTGTSIKISYPKVSAPKWIAGKIPLNVGDLLIILDDDESIHSGWNTFFEPHMENILIKHFSDGKVAIEFINKLTPEHRARTFLLSDYELLKQEVNGLDVIDQTKMSRSILVTSHHADKDIRERAAKMKVRILPKPLSSEIKVVFGNENPVQPSLFDDANVLSFDSEKITHFKEVDLIIVDDDEDIIDNLKTFTLNGKIVDSFTDIRDFIQHVSEYTKTTKMLIDYTYVNETTNGIDIVQALQAKGYTNCYLYSGMQFNSADLPGNINVIMKNELHKIMDLCGITDSDINNNQHSTEDKSADLFSMNNMTNFIDEHRSSTNTNASNRTDTEKLARKVSHDIRTPIASLEAIIQASATLSDVERIALKKLSNKLSDIANNVVAEYSNQQIAPEKEVIILVRDTLTNIIKEQNYIDTKFSITFESKVVANFAAIKLTLSSFKSMVTEVLNMAVKSLAEVAVDGRLSISLNVNGEFAVITIEDNAGKYLSDELVDKINKNEVIDASNPDNANAITLTKIRDTLKSLLGVLVIYFTANARTKIALRIPLATEPNWLATQITMRTEDQILILGANSSEYNEWQKRILEGCPKITINQIKPLQNSTELVALLTEIPAEQLNNICLIGSYSELHKYQEYLKAKATTSLIKRTIAITSAYNDDAVIGVITTLNAKILPESLTPFIPLIFEEQLEAQSKVVDMVWLDDEKAYLDDMVDKFYNHLTVDKYYDPTTFLDYFIQYPLNTKIFLDHNYYSCDNYKFDVNGVTVAARLHDQGYTNLFLISGEDVPGKPDYLTVILKTDSEKLQTLDKL